MADAPACATDDDFQFGVKTKIGYCCNRPAGCSLDADGCLWKRQKAERLATHNEVPRG